jgi:hypothetical protein
MIGFDTSLAVFLDWMKPPALLVTMTPVAFRNLGQPL